jgi:undecaprenyl-diphosphatase
MDLIHAIVLAVVQGLTEFLPISSSAHLIIVPWLFGWEDPGLAFDAALHLGTLAAVYAYFWRDLVRMARALPRALRRPLALLRDPAPGAVENPLDLDARLALLIAVGTIPGLIIGFAGEGAIDTYFHSADHRRTAIALIAVALIVLAVVLAVAERVAVHQRQITHLTWRDAVAIGLAQASALIPGISRSGATITVGLFRGVRRADAARYSFLLSLPIIAGAGTKAVYSGVEAGLSGSETRAFIIGAIISGLVGLLSIWGLLRFLERASTSVFIVYRITLGLFLLVLLIAEVR